MRIEDHLAKVRAFERAMAVFDNPDDWRLCVWMIEKAATHRMNAMFHALKLTPIHAPGAADLPGMEKRSGRYFQDAARYRLMAARGDLVHARFRPPDLLLNAESRRVVELMAFIEHERVGVVRSDAAYNEVERIRWLAVYSELVNLTERAVRNRHG